MSTVNTIRLSHPSRSCFTLTHPLTHRPSSRAPPPKPHTHPLAPQPFTPLTNYLHSPRSSSTTPTASLTHTLPPPPHTATHSHPPSTYSPLIPHSPLTPPPSTPSPSQHAMVISRCGSGYRSCPIAQCGGPHFTAEGFSMLGLTLAECVRKL